MSENERYDNRVSNGFMQYIGTVIRIFERAFVVFFEGIRNAVESGTPSMLGFFSAFLPIMTPLPVAGMTAISLQQFFSWDAWQAWTMAASIEVAGFVLWVHLTETLMNDGWKGTTMQFFFSIAVLVYHAILIVTNAVLASYNNEGGPRVTVLVLLSFLPALGSVAYGYRTVKIERKVEKRRQEKASQAERVRQEKRQDKRADNELKLKYAKDVRFTGFTGERRPTIEKTCEGCGGTFKTTNPKKKYHNATCRQRAHRAKA